MGGRHTLRGRRTRFAAGVAILGALISGPLAFPTTAVAVGEPSITWVNLDNQTGSGVVELRALSTATSGTIVKWCLTHDGVPVTQNVAGPGDYLTYDDVYYYSTFSAATGCWTGLGTNLGGASFLVDTTAWTDGAHTFTVTVTDSSLRTTASTLSVPTLNPAPIASWTTPDATAFRGNIVLRARASADPSGTAIVTRWCLTQDGTRVTSNIATVGDYTTYSKVHYYSTFNPATGCWTSDGADLTGAEFTIDATTWADAAHTYRLTVTDSSGRTTTSTTLTITTDNPAPTVTWTTPDATAFRGNIVLRARASADPSGTAIVTRWCLTQDGTRVTSNIATVGDYTTYSKVHYYSTFNPATGCWTSDGADLTGAEFTIDATTWADAAHTYRLTVTDSSGRTTTSTTLTITTDNPAPTVTWTTPDATTQSGNAYIRATAAADPTGTATITKWCLTFEGIPVPVDIATVGDYDTYSKVHYYSTFNPATGCWTSDGTDLTGGEFGFDTSGWDDGTYTFGLTVTDSSGRSGTATPLTVVTSNPAPNLLVTAPPAPPSTVSRRVAISATASAAATSTGIVDSWCLARDGSPIRVDVTEQISGFGANTVRDYGTFQPSTGCWTGSGDDLTDGAFSIDTTTWSDGQHTIRLTVHDSAGKSSVVDISLATSNPLPNSSVSGVRSGAVLSRQATFTMAATFVAAQSDLSIGTWCLSIDRGPCIRPTAGGNRATWSVNTAAMRNGAHTATFSARDTAGRLITKPAIPFTVSNTKPAVVSAIGAGAPTRLANTASTVNLTVRTTGASQITVRWGTSRTALTSSKTWSASAATNAATRLPIGGLRFGAVYYFEVRAKNSQGLSTTTIYSFRAPSKPYIVRTTCTSYINWIGLIYWFTHEYTYWWSSGEQTYSKEYAGRC